MTEEVVHTHEYPANPFSQIVYFVVGIITLLLALRFIFLLLGVNEVAIVSFVYDTTSFFVEPFYGLFGRELLSGTQRFEIEALIAILVVWLVGGVLASIFRIFR